MLKNPNITVRTIVWLLTVTVLFGVMSVFQPIVANAADDPKAWYDEDPAQMEFFIKTAEELAYFAELVNNAPDSSGSIFNGKTITLTSDIDLVDIPNWMPIGTYSSIAADRRAFKGIFDGDGYAISNLTINSSGDNQGLFGNLNGSAKNLALVNINVLGSNYVGGVTGRVVSPATISNIYVTGTIISTGSNGYAGGISGNYGNIDNCYTDVNITAAQRAGGIAGQIGTSNIVANCYAMGTITISGKNYIGGIVGCQSGNIAIENSVALNAVLTTGATGSVYAGRISAGGMAGTPTLINNYAFDGMQLIIVETPMEDIVCFNDNNNGASLSTSDLFLTATWTDTVNFSEIDWIIADNKRPILRVFEEGNSSVKQDAEYPAYIKDSSSGASIIITDANKWYYVDENASGVLADTFYIKDAGQLEFFAFLVNEGRDKFENKTVKLANDIDLSGIENWTPIGANKVNNTFWGTFDGDGYVVKNLTINRPNDEYQGLFSFVSAATIKNLGVVDVSIIGGNACGGIAGYVGEIENCFATGTVSGSGASGGVAGEVSRAAKNCYSTTTGTARGGAFGAGGLTNSTKPFEYLYSTGNRTVATLQYHDDDFPRVLKNVVVLTNQDDGRYRLTNYDMYQKTYANNYVWVKKTAEPTGSVHDNDKGADLISAEVYSGKVWGEGYAAFPTDGEDGWIIEAGKLPILKVFETRNDERGGESVQPSEIPAHILAELNECAIEEVIIPANTTTTETGFAASVASGVNLLTVDIVVSDFAVWELYDDATYETEIEDKTITLAVGTRNLFIKVIAPNGDYAEYTLDVTRAGTSSDSGYTPPSNGTTIDDDETPLAGALPFNDVAEDDWFYDSVKYGFENKLMNGLAEDEFVPNLELSRAMLVTILYRQAGEPDIAGGSPGFNDVPDGEWYSDAVAWAAEIGVVNGYGDGSFGPHDNITREQFALIMYNYAKWLELDVAAVAILDDYADADKIADWALEAMRWAVAEDLIKGRSDTELAPKGTATRAEAATILMRFVEQIVK